MVGCLSCAGLTLGHTEKTGRPASSPHMLHSGEVAPGEAGDPTGGGLREARVCLL